jgi:hypothetical protein
MVHRYKFIPFYHALSYDDISIVFRVILSDLNNLRTSWHYKRWFEVVKLHLDRKYEAKDLAPKWRIYCTYCTWVKDKISSNRNYKTEGTKSKTPNKIPKSKEIMRRQIRNHPNRCKTLLGNLSIKRSATKGNSFMK